MAVCNRCMLVTACQTHAAREVPPPPYHVISVTAPRARTLHCRETDSMLLVLCCTCRATLLKESHLQTLSFQCGIWKSLYVVKSAVWFHKGGDILKNGSRLGWVPTNQMSATPKSLWLNYQNFLVLVKYSKTEDSSLSVAENLFLQIWTRYIHGTV